MVNLIIGNKGSGKTKHLVERVTDTANESKGNVICVDKGSRLAMRLPSNIRFIDIDDYNISGSIAFYGFLIGLCSGDYDLTDVFVDSTLDIIANNNTDMNDFFTIVSKLSETTKVNFHFSICSKDEIDDMICRYSCVAVGK